ncbi:hypothetical protein CEXT_152941 [Caerostris extrusa]|uniref:Uncharacterized protein n=1 Tax=Caerostris extrusa TaxID=172846 RepID=A0AAV4NQK1_CAEEX|nr:hypothetical protein CEXT_152941 [Caerostris extrusa]
MSSMTPKQRRGGCEQKGLRVNGHHVPRERRRSFARKGWEIGGSRSARSPFHGHKMQGAVCWEYGNGFTLNQAEKDYLQMH